MYRRELGPDERPSKGVYMTVAAVADRSPVELDPLAKTLNPDALNALIEDTRSRVCQVRFTYAGHEITVTGEEIYVASQP